MTVSRVMRNSALVRPETSKRVLLAAERINYQPDPLAARLMAAVRRGKRTGTKATLALVRHTKAQAGGTEDFHRYVKLDEVKSRAEKLGYGVDEMFLGENGLTPQRLRSILKARGIEGVLFSSEVPEKQVTDFDFSSLACASFGYGLLEPSLHRASTNMMQGLLSAFGWLEERGYRRIGLAVTPWVDHRSNHTYSGAIRHYQAGLPRSRRVPPLFFPENRLAENRRGFSKWMKAHRPDAIVSFNGLVPDWIREEGKLELPGDIGFLIHDWTERDAAWSGINHNRQDVAAAAVDLVTTQLYHGEHGRPAVPRQVLIPATLVDRGTCPKR